MQGVKVGDLKFDALTSATQQLIKDLQSAQQALEKTFNQGFKEAASNSKELQDAFKILNIDPDKLSVDKIGTKLSSGLQTAQDALDKTNKKLDELKAKQQETQAELDKITNSPFGASTKDVTSESLFNQFFDISKARDNSKELENWLEDVRQKFITASQGIKNSSKKQDAQNLIDGLIGITDPNEIRTKIESIVTIIKENSANLSNLRTAFGADGKRTANSIIESIIGSFDFKSLNTDVLKQQLQAVFDNFQGLNLSADKKQELLESVTGLTEDGIKAWSDKVTAALGAFHKQTETEAANLIATLSKIGEAIAGTEVTQGEQQGKVNILQAGNNDYLKRIDELQGKVSQQQEEINNLRRELEAALAQKDSGTVKAGEGAVKSGAEGLNENTKAAQQYTQQLERVKEAEKMVGKIEGIAQRWFSVYAAVNMVTKAISSMKSTIAELDKTITEIAIVTNMSQGDLWGQMGAYTQLAKEYAASISGVYKVSQLYYQQGLQTADVMALTESTLKMARISGLDYAEATNYMTNAVRSFKMEMSDAERVVDVYSAIAAKSATDVSELAIAMSKTASSAEAVGSSFENTTAMMAVMIEATRESSQNIGSAMKSIISRYGELKENPTTLVDSEGEELSLNKVDTALQSVGITLHNTAGQFRDFDDVIMELAAAWDTIDVNTQRYIATVMAGNRQQSRFLALVSNYGRYKELSEEAANAENAAQLQFLKTLDSIEAKSQQVQTSLQSLYTSSGLENLYKGILDITNAIISSFTAMPTIMNLPIVAIAKFGMTFWSLASVVKNAFALIFNYFKVEQGKWNLLDLQSKQQTEQDKLKAVKERVAAEMRVEEEGLTHKRRLRQRETQDVLTDEQAKTKARQELLQDKQLKSENNLRMGLNIGALAANLAGTALKSQDNRAAQVAGGFASIGGSALSGAAMLAAIPGGAGVGAALGAILGAVQNFNTILPSTTEQLKNLTEIADNAKNKALQEQAEANALESSVTKLKELTATRYNSIEAEQEYLEANNTLAQQYPELISYYDESGNAIINLEQANQLLIESLKESTDATINSAAANFKQAKKQAEKDKEDLEKNNISSSGEAYALLDSFLSGQLDVNASPKDIQNRIKVIGENGESTSRSILNVQSDLGKILAEKFQELSEDEVWPWIEEQAEIFSSIQGPDKEIFQALVLTAEAYKEFNTGVEAAFNRTAKSVKSGVISTINSLYTEGEQTAPKVVKAIKELNGGFELIQQLAIQKISKQDFKTDEEYKEALRELDLSELWDEITVLLQRTGHTTDEFSKLLSQRAQVSENSFKTNLSNFLNNYFPTDELYEALLAPFKEQYNIDTFKIAVQQFTEKDSYIDAVLSNYYNDFYNNLHETELEIILSESKRTKELIDNGKLTQQQGTKYLNTYAGLWAQLEFIDDIELQNKAEQALVGWDHTREGLENILTLLKDSGIESALPAIESVGALIPLISQNLNTTFQTLATSISSKVKDFKDISQLSKGVEIDKAIKYAEELELSFSDLVLDYSTGLFKLGDTTKAYNHYFTKVEDQIKKADEQLQLYKDNSKDIQWLMTFGDQKTRENNIVAQGLYERLGEKGLKKEEVDSVISEFQNSDYTNFDKWLIDHYQNLSKTLQNALTDAKARAELNTGNITNFVKQAIGVTQDVAEIIASSLIKEGRFNYDAIEKALDDAGKDVDNIDFSFLENYGISIADALGETAKGVYDKAIESITKGPQQIKVTEGNEAALKALGIDTKDKDIVTIDWSETDTKNYQERINDILSSGMSQENIDSALSAVESAVYKIDVSEAINSVISSYEGFGIETANKFAQALGSNLKDFIDNQVFIFDDITGQYSTNLQYLRNVAATAKGLTDKQRNAALASIDKQVREASGMSVFNDIAKDYNNLTEDAIQKLADTLHKPYDLVKAYLISNGDGTYKVDLTRLQKLQQDLGAAADKNAQETVASIIDEYISQLSNISQIQSSGYTNLADMQKVANELGTTTDTIFEWDQNLKAYILNTAGIKLSAQHSKEELSKISDSAQRQQAIKLIESNAQTLAEAIDYKALISSLSDGTFEKQSTIFRKSVVDYNLFIRQFGEKGILFPSELIDELSQGGMKALEAAWKIAKRTGQDLTGADVESIYRSGAERINTALSQMTLSVGSVIDETTVELLDIGAQVQNLGGGKAVITGVIDMVSAYEKLYEKMQNETGHTLAELNNIQAKIATEKEQGTLLESLSNISEMSYETLGEIATNIGKSFDQLYNMLVAGDAVKNLGGGKIRITDFDYFAKLTGLLDKSSEEYINVLSQYNDSIIEANRSRADKVLDEIKAVSEAKTGDQINITNLYTGLTESARKGFERWIAKTGAEIENGILNINDASVPQVLEILKHVANSFDDIAARDKAEIEDAFEALLKNITDSIKQGLEGKLSNVGKVDLQESLKSAYGVELKDSDFTKTADGFKMTEQAAIRVYNTMKDIDALQASLVLTELNNSLKESNEHYKSMGDIMNHIADLNKKINELPANDERRQKYQEELELAKEIAQVRATTDDSASFAFMDNKLPGAMENPLTYAENWGKAIHILQKGSGDKKGFIDARDWYNIVNEMNNIAGVTGQSIDLFGHTLNGKLESASALIQEGFNNLKSIDGGKMQVDLSATLGGIGNAFEKGAIDAEGSITKGIHAMAQSQIDMLDGLIAVLETIVAMQEAFEGLKASKDGQLDLNELFENVFVTDTNGITKALPGKLQATEEFKTAAQKLIDKFKGFDDLKNPLKQIKVNGTQLGDLLSDATKGIAFSTEQAEGLSAAMNALYQASLSGNYDLDNIYESVKTVLQESGIGGKGLSIDIGDTTLYLTGNVITQIDWKSDKVKNALKNFSGSDEEKKKAAQAAMEAWDKNPLQLTDQQLKFVLEVSPGVTVVLDEKGNKTGEYIVDGATYKNEKDAGNALLLKELGADKVIYANPKDKTGVNKGIIQTTEKKGIEIILEEGKPPIFKYGEITGESVDDVINQWVQQEYGQFDNLTDEQIETLTYNKKFELGLVGDGNFNVSKNLKPDMDLTKAFQEWFTQGDYTKEGLQKFLSDNNLDKKITIGANIDEKLTGDNLKELGQIFGTDVSLESKQLSLSVSMAEGTPPTLAELLNNQTATATLKLNVTGANGENGASIVGLPNPAETTTPINIKAPMGQLNVSGKPESVNAPGIKFADLSSDDKQKTNIVTAASKWIINTLGVTKQIIGSPSTVPDTEHHPEVTGTANKYTAEVNEATPKDTTGNIGDITDEKGKSKVSGVAGLYEAKIEDGTKKMAFGEPTSVPGSSHPTVKSNAGAFLVNMANVMGDPAFEGDTEKQVKYNKAVEIVATSLRWNLNEVKTAEDTEGAEGNAKTWVDDAKEQLNGVISTILATDDNGNFCIPLDKQVDMLYQLGEWVEKVDEAGKAQAAGQKPPQPKFPEGWCDDNGNLLTDKILHQLYGIDYVHDGTKDTKDELPEVENPPPITLTQEIIYQFVHKFKDEGEITKNINDELGNGQIISDLQSKNDEQVKKYTNYLDELFTFKKQGGEFDENRINNIAELKRLMELADITETENYQKYFGKNGAFNVGTEKGEYTVSINPEINLENTSETEQSLVKEGNAESELETTIEDTIASASSVIQELFTNGFSKATLDVIINPNGKLPGEEGNDGSGDEGDKGGKKTNTHTPVGGRITTTGNNNSDDTTKRNASGRKSSSKKEFNQATIETDVEMSTEGLSEPQQDLISKGETQTTMTIQQFAEQNGLIDRGLLASNNGMGSQLGEELSQFEQNPVPQIEATAEALRLFAETEAVSNPELSNTLKNLADQAYTICGVDAGQLERLYHILENLPGAANTFMNDANWQGLVQIIKQLSATNTGGEGGGLTLDIESEPDETLLKILALFEASGIKISLNTNTPNPVPEGGNGGNPPEGDKGGKKPPEEKPNETSNTSGQQGKPIIGADGKPLLDANGNQVYSNVPENAVMAEAQIIDNGGYTPKPITTSIESKEADNKEDPNKEIKADTLNAEVKGNTEFNAEGAVEQETPSPAPEAPEAPAAPEAPETPTETPEADTSGVEQLETAMTDMSAYAASAVEPINGVGSGLQTISSSASNLGSEAATIANNVSEAGNAATTAAGKLDELTGAINRIPSHTTIGIDAHVDLEVTASITEEKKGDAPAKGNADVDIKMGETSLSQSDFTISKAKGTNLALPKGNATTLMGELGPELYVSNGRYQVVGQNGAEFVDLPKDAIVFNHKKTAQLLKNGHMSGRGRPFTNISNALSFAKGSLEGGPAMASAAAALAALKQLRAMWASMLNASAKDLGSQAGRGGGGGGGKDENGNYKQPTNVIKDIERWYNLERQIANLEKEITYQQKLQAKYESDRVANGEKIFETQRKQLEALQSTVVRQRELSKLQRSWYDNKRKELEESSYGKIFTYDENGLQQYVGNGKPGSGLGLDILEHLTRRNVNGQAIGDAKTAKSQLKYLQSVGFDINDLIYNDDGTKVVKKVGKNLRLTKMEGDEDTDDEELYAKMMENFWNNLDGWKDELDSLYDGIQDTINEIEENQKKQNDIINKWIDNDIDIRNKIRDAIVAREQATIDKLQEQKDAIEESTDRFIDGLNEALEKDKQRSEENKADQELTKLQRQLAILQRSGGSATQIKQLQDQISQKQEDMYFDERQKQIEAIQEASDKELERLDQQIELLTETLEYQKENGLLWNEVESIIEQGNEFATAFYAQWSDKLNGENALSQDKTLREIQQQLQQSEAFGKYKQEQADTESVIKDIAERNQSSFFTEGMTDEEKADAHTIAADAATVARREYLEKNPGDISGANNAAEDAYTASLRDTWEKSDSGKKSLENFGKQYENWLTNRRLKDTNDFTNTQEFKSNEAEFRNTLQESFYQYKAKNEDDETAWSHAIQDAEKAIQNRAQGELDEGTSGKISEKAQGYIKDVNGNLTKMTGTIFAKNQQFTFDNAAVGKIGKKNYDMLHVKGYKEDEGWINKSKVSGGKKIFNNLASLGNTANAPDISGDVNLGDPNKQLELEGFTYKNMTNKNWFKQNTISLKDGSSLTFTDGSEYGMRIKDASGLQFKNDGKLKAKGNITVDAVSVDKGKFQELTTPKQFSIKDRDTIRNAINAKITSTTSDWYNKLKYLNQYKEGGMAYATGPAWLDGTKTKPEAVLNAKQTEFLKHDLLGSQNDSLMSMVHQLQDIYEQNTSNVSNISNNDIGTFIERIDVTFESGVIRDDYDMKRASNMFKNELLRIARKTTTVNVKRR